jgi:hypothetical protein
MGTFEAPPEIMKSAITATYVTAHNMQNTFN